MLQEMQEELLDELWRQERRQYGALAVGVVLEAHKRAPCNRERQRTGPDTGR